MAGRLLLLFIIVPLLEIMLLATLGARIGFPATLGIIVVTAILGASLARAQGLRTLQRLREALARGRLPHAEVMDGLMILIAGAVLLTPGFLTDAAGFLLLVPPVRARVRQSLEKALKGRIHVIGMPPSDGQVNDPGARERVVEARVIDDPGDEHST